MYVEAYNQIRSRAGNNATAREYNTCLSQATSLMSKAMRLPLDGDADIATIDFRIEVATLMQNSDKLKVFQEGNQPPVYSSL